MISLLLHLLRLFPFLCGGHRQLALENLALRQQLAVYKKARVLGAGVLWPPVVSLTLGWSGRAQPVVQRPQTHRARHRALLPKETPHNPWCCSSTRFSTTLVLSAMTKPSVGRRNQRTRSDDSRSERRVSRR